MEFIGFTDPKQIKVYDSDFELLKNCHIAIIRFDGTEWKILTQDEDLYRKLQDTFEIEERIPAEDYFRKY